MIQRTSRPITACQACRKNMLRSILFVGYLAPVNAMAEIGSVPQEQPAYPLELLTCGGCGLAQIGLEVDREILFPTGLSLPIEQHAHPARQFLGSLP